MRKGKRQKQKKAGGQRNKKVKTLFAFVTELWLPFQKAEAPAAEAAPTSSESVKEKEEEAKKEKVAQKTTESEKKSEETPSKQAEQAGKKAEEEKEEGEKKAETAEGKTKAEEKKESVTAENEKTDQKEKTEEEKGNEKETAEKKPFSFGSSTGTKPLFSWGSGGSGGSGGGLTFGAIASKSDGEKPGWPSFSSGSGVGSSSFSTSSSSSSVSFLQKNGDQPKSTFGQSKERATEGDDGAEQQVESEKKPVIAAAGESSIFPFYIFFNLSFGSLVFLLWFFFILEEKIE